MWNWLKGKKTYIAASLGVAYAWLGVYLGHDTVQHAISMTGDFVLASTIRNGISTTLVTAAEQMAQNVITQLTAPQGNKSA